MDNRFQGRFNLALPGIIITEEPSPYPNKDWGYRVGLFDYSQAYAFFSLDLDLDKIKVYAINEEEMKIERVITLDDAKRFFNA